MHQQDPKPKQKFSRYPMVYERRRHGMDIFMPLCESKPGNDVHEFHRAPRSAPPRPRRVRSLGQHQVLLMSLQWCWPKPLEVHAGSASRQCLLLSRRLLEQSKFALSSRHSRDRGHFPPLACTLIDQVCFEPSRLSFADNKPDDMSFRPLPLLLSARGSPPRTPRSCYRLRW